MDYLVIGDHNCRIRPVRRTDLLKIFEIEKRVFGEDKFDVMLLRDLLKHAILFIILENSNSEEMLGFSIAMQLDSQEFPSGSPPSFQVETTAHIVNFAIDTPYHHQGLGKMMLHHSLEELRKLGYQKVQLEVNTSNQPAISLYTKFGFRQGEYLLNYYRSGANAYRMDLDLQNN